jgi:uncharacterized protein YndB with AHSA1/START domain/predicted transcriptional regulator
VSTSQAIVFSALADQTRLTIVDLLAQRGELSASDISAVFSSTASAISQHLKVLREAGLVLVTKQGQRRIYQLNTAAIDETERWLHLRTRQWNTRLDAMEALIQRLDKGLAMTNNETRDIIITRILNAPVETLWNLWTDPAALTQWWGPQDYTSPSAHIDLREGGAYLFAMQAPAEQGGLVSYTAGTYAKIAPMERLEFTQNLSDEAGVPLPDEALPDGFSQNIYTIVEFRDVNGLTELTITEKGWTRSLMAVFSYAGMHQSLDKVAALLERLRVA